MAATHQHNFFESLDNYTSELIYNPGKHYDLHYWSYLIPTLCVAGIGTALIPHFALGVAVGITTAIVLRLFMGLISQIWGDPKENKTMTALIMSDPLTATLCAPLMEEFLFRGLIQPLLVLMLTCLAPGLAAIPFLTIGLSLALIASIICTSSIFGIIHLANSTDLDNYYQVIGTTLAGITFGVISAQFGLAAAIAAHIALNTISITMLKLERYSEEYQSTFGNVGSK